VELIGDTEANITMTATVPLGFSSCNDLSFKYDHAVSGVSQHDCKAFFREGRLQHTLNLRVNPAPGCNSYSSLMEFKPFTKPGESMWRNYVPSNITVRLQYSWKSCWVNSFSAIWTFTTIFCKTFNQVHYGDISSD